MRKEKYIVCLDPGHGPKTVNASPDGTYREATFTWDMYKRIRRKLEEKGFRVIATRREEEKPSLSDRSMISNLHQAELFVSIHSNAAGDGSWNDAKGLMIFTSSPPMTEKRNIAAKLLVNAFQKAGVEIFGSGIAHNETFTVLSKTDAPACLIEYGFHTNKEDVEKLKKESYREQLSHATVSGICSFFGTEDEKEDGVAQWAKEAWEKATERAILDGTRPQDPVTRQEMSVILDRLGLL